MGADACFVYFASCQEFVKIGIARDTYSRIKTLASGCPWPVELAASMMGGEREEHMLHVAFKRHGLHHRGEWYRNEGPLAELLAAITAQPPRRARALADQFWMDRFPGRSQLASPQSYRLVRELQA